LRGDTFSAFPFVEEFAAVVPNLIMKDGLSGANDSIDTKGLLFLIGNREEKISERCKDKAFSQHVKGHIADVWRGSRRKIPTW